LIKEKRKWVLVAGAGYYW